MSCDTISMDWKKRERKQEIEWQHWKKMRRRKAKERCPQTTFRQGKSGLKRRQQEPFGQNKGTVV